MARAAALALVSTIALSSCRKARVAEDVPAPNVTLFGVRMQYFKEGRLSSTGQAAQVTYHRASGDVTAVEGRLHLIRGKGAPGQAEALGDVDVHAPQVEGNLLRGYGEGRGGVEVLSGAQIARTDQAVYDGPAQRARGSTPVSIEGPNYSLQSDSFALDFASDEYAFDGGVRTHLGGRK